jgi:hypothetical protein
MAHPQVADGREGLQIWRRAEKVWSSSLGFGKELTTLQRKNLGYKEMFEKGENFNKQTSREKA